jgi:hypothetical protein
MCFRSFRVLGNIRPVNLAMIILIAEVIGICLSLVTASQLTAKRYGPDKKVEPWAGYTQAAVV